MTHGGDWTQVCDDATWVYVLQKLDHDTYSVESAGEVSLVNRQTLEDLLRLKLQGGHHEPEVGGGHVG